MLSVFDGTGSIIAHYTGTSANPGDAVLSAIARARGLKTMVGQVLAANTQMLGLATALGFVINETPRDLSVKEVRLAL